MQSPIQKFRQSLIVFEKPGKSENFGELQLPYSSIFFTESSVIWKTYKGPVSAHLFFTFLLITQDLNTRRHHH